MKPERRSEAATGAPARGRRLSTAGFEIRGPIDRDDLPGLSQRVCAVLRDTPASVLVCEVGGVDVDAVTIDALARLALAARRYDRQIRLVGTSPALVALIGLMGLESVLLDDRGRRSALRPSGGLAGE